VPENRLRPLISYAFILMVVALIGARWLHRESTAPSAAVARGDAAIEVRTQAGERATVHVTGEVRHPGVYRLRPGARVHEAVARAGGPTRRADTTQINLAAKVEDGRQVLVPARVAAGAVGASAGGPAAASASGLPVNLNTATLEQLDALDGIGPQTAQQILEYRDANDGFGSVEELGEVPGIGDKRLASLREQVRV
jgi:competence protein ComEA